MPAPDASTPRCILKHNTVPIGVFKRLSKAVPIWIKRRDSGESGIIHTFNRPFPLDDIRKVKNQQVIFAGCTANTMPRLSGKLKMIEAPGRTNNQPIKAIMITKFKQDLQAQTINIERFQCLDIIG